MYQLAQSNLWTGRLDSETDPTQFRHFQTVKFGDLSQLDFSDEHKGVGLLGYAIDKGVELLLWTVLMMSVARGPGGCLWVYLL